MPYLDARVLDYGLAILVAEATRLTVNPAQPVDYAACLNGILGHYSMFGVSISGGVLVTGPSGDGMGGRRVIVQDIKDGAVVRDGTAAVWCIVDDNHKRLLACGPLAVPLAVVTGNDFTLTSFNLDGGSSTMSDALWDTLWSNDPSVGTVGDWNIASAEEVGNSGGLQNADPIGTAVLLALFTDARLPDYMVGRFGFTKDDQLEWHGNTVAVEPGEEPLGSLLWTLRRAPLTKYTCRMAEHFCAMALMPLVRAKICIGFDIHAEIDPVNVGRLTINIKTYAQGEREWVADIYAIQ